MSEEYKGNSSRTKNMLYGIGTVAFVLILVTILLILQNEQASSHIASLAETISDDKIKISHLEHENSDLSEKNLMYQSLVDWKQIWNKCGDSSNCRYKGLDFYFYGVVESIYNQDMIICKVFSDDGPVTVYAKVSKEEAESLAEITIGAGVQIHGTCSDATVWYDCTWEQSEAINYIVAFDEYAHTKDQSE